MKKTRRYLILNNAQVQLALAREVLRAHAVELPPGQVVNIQVMQTQMIHGVQTNQVLQTRVEVEYEQF